MSTSATASAVVPSMGLAGGRPENQEKRRRVLLFTTTPIHHPQLLRPAAWGRGFHAITTPATN